MGMGHQIDFTNSLKKIDRSRPGRNAAGFLVFRGLLWFYIRIKVFLLVN
jgi:hypothetical protein